MKNRMELQISAISNNSRRRNYEIEDLSKPSDKVRAEGLRRADEMISNKVGKKTSTNFVSNIKISTFVNVILLQISAHGIKAKNDVEYIRYTPNQNGDAFNSGAKQRIIKMTTIQ